MSPRFLPILNPILTPSFNIPAGETIFGKLLQHQRKIGTIVSFVDFLHHMVFALLIGQTLMQVESLAIHLTVFIFTLLTLVKIIQNWQKG